MAAAEPSKRRWTFGRVVLLVLGCLAVLVAVGLLASGCAVLWADSQRDSDGFLSTRTERIESDGYAVVSESADLNEDWADHFLGEVRLRGESADGGDLFLGIGPTEDVDAYLNGTALSEVVDFDTAPFRVRYREHEGRSPAGLPGDETFWAASAEGPGEQALTWEVEDGNWRMVAMNADGSEGVAADVGIGIEADFLIWAAIALLIVGGLALAAGVLLIFLALRRRPVAALEAGVPAAPLTAVTVSADYPVALRGAQDEELSRWLWLVKWLLAIPHYIVLFFLWIAFLVLTVVAFFGILFTGRYPRSVFEFNVGVIRWAWRVSFYSYGALGTDRYPPFSMDPEPDYPATVEIRYPEEGLSRGLVLVKWWLLAIPQYLIVSIFVGGWWLWDWDAWWFCGLIGVVVLIGGFALLFVGRFPRGLFDLALGLDRWVVRVLVYAALMSDKYPPFRLDQGGEEPEIPTPTPAIPSGTS